MEKPFGTFHGELVYLADVSDEQLYMYKFILHKSIKILCRLSLIILFLSDKINTKLCHRMLKLFFFIS